MDFSLNVIFANSNRWNDERLHLVWKQPKQLQQQQQRPQQPDCDDDDDDELLVNNGEPNSKDDNKADWCMKQRYQEKIGEQQQL